MLKREELKDKVIFGEHLAQLLEDFSIENEETIGRAVKWWNGEITTENVIGERPIFLKNGKQKTDKKGRPVTEPIVAEEGGMLAYNRIKQATMRERRPGKLRENLNQLQPIFKKILEVE